MLRLFPTQVYADTGEKVDTALVVEKLLDPQRNELHYRLEDGRVGRATHGGRGCTIVAPSQLPPLRVTF